MKYAPRSGRRIFGVVADLERLGLPLRVILDDHTERPENAHHPRRGFVQVFAYSVLEKRNIDDVLAFGDTNALTERPNRRRGIAATPHRPNRGHPRIVPRLHMALLHQLE